MFLILGFCLTSQISISCEAQFLKKEKIVIENKLSKNKEFFLVELAKNEYERKKGLQCKKYLKKNEGMLFIWSDENYRNFWQEEYSHTSRFNFINSKFEIVDIYFNATPFSKNQLEVKEG